MANTPNANNNSTTKEFYNSRVLYDNLYEQTERQFDLWYDIPLYGKVDELGRVVYPKESFLEIVSKDEDDEIILCLSFVSQAFKKMRLHYETLFLDGYLDSTSEFFTNTLTPVKGWTSPTTNYQDNLQSLYEQFFNDQLVGLSDSQIIKDFDTFVELFLQYIKDTKKAFTRIGLHESKEINVNNAGLAIEIFEGEYGDDSQAFEFVNDTNFELFEELCGKYGFRIDRNVPWRLVFNITSKKSQPFIKEQVTTEDRSVGLKELFNLFYERLDLVDYFNEFYDELFIFYTTFIQAFPRYKEQRQGKSNCAGIFYTFKDRQVASPRESLNNKLAYYKQTEQILKLFYDFRVAESGLKVDRKKKSFHLKNVLGIYAGLRGKNEKLALSKALDYIQYNLGTAAYRDVTLNQNNLTRLDGGVMMSPQDQFDKRTGEDSSYLNDFSDSW